MYDLLLRRWANWLRFLPVLQFIGQIYNLLQFWMRIEVLFYIVCKQRAIYASFIYLVYFGL